MDNRDRHFLNFFEFIFNLWIIVRAILIFFEFIFNFMDTREGNFSQFFLEFFF